VSACRILGGLAGRVAELAKGAGLYYPDSLLRGVEVALGLPHRFVIFYGPPGVGKSRLVQLIAEALQADLRLVPVQASWQDSSALIGSYDPVQRCFLPGELVSLAFKAAAEPTRHFALCLERTGPGRA